MEELLIIKLLQHTRARVSAIGFDEAFLDNTPNKGSKRNNRQTGVHESL